MGRAARAAGLACAGLALALALVLLARRPVTLFQADSPFGRVRVVEYADGLRALYLGEGRARQSALYPDRPLHLEHAYTRVAMAGLALAPRRGRLLFVGLGGGAMPTYARLVRPDARLDVVEIDSLVVQAAIRFFGFEPGGAVSIQIEDGRRFIERADPGRWDAIFLDAFSDDAIPYALTTRDFLQAVGRSLAPGGVVVANLWTSHPTYTAMVATYQAVFPEVARLQVPGRAQVVLLASATPGRLGRAPLLAAADSLARDAELGFDLARLISRGWERPPASPAAVLRDSL